MKDQTKCVQTRDKDEEIACINLPLYRGVIYRHKDFTHQPGQFAYARCATPTTEALGDLVADLEGGVKGFTTSSGMGAISVVMKLFHPGDHIIVTADLYGGTYRYFHDYLQEYGFEFSYVESWNIDSVKAAVRPNTKCIFIETPSNPSMHVTDLAAVSEIAKANGALLVVDNTFLSPYFQKPLSFGADIVVHSATKYLGGHNDILGGVIVAANQELAEKIFAIYMAEGNNLGSEDAWLLIRSIKTLAVRMDRQQENALAIYEYLKTFDSIKDVLYVGDPTREDYALSKRQTSGFGGMISIRVKDKTKIQQYLQRLKVFSFAESLGGVESLATYPWTATQAPIPEEQRNATGATEDLIRLSIGIENVEDLKEDLRQAFEQA
ncbi:MAG: PLP-dependent transferase [Lachnospiraceae bacterium]|nr:PLP-dependent transferase [Lachnospiraceae bacterium]